MDETLTLHKLPSVRSTTTRSTLTPTPRRLHTSVSAPRTSYTRVSTPSFAITKLPPVNLGKSNNSNNLTSLSQPGFLAAQTRSRSLTDDENARKKRRKRSRDRKPSTSNAQNDRNNNKENKDNRNIEKSQKSRRARTEKLRRSDPKKSNRPKEERLSKNKTDKSKTIRSLNEQATPSLARRSALKSTDRRHHSVPAPDSRQKRRDSVNEGLCMECTEMQRIDDEELLLAKYQIGTCLGQGNFAVVSKCTDTNDKSEWALKEIDVHQLNGKTYCIENEADLMFRYTHKNIVQLREAFHTPETYYLVLEIASNGDLFDLIKRDGPMSEQRVSQIVGDAAEALRYLHRNRVVHRDIKPENLLLTNDMRVKLTDFGLACRLQGRLYRVCGTPTYVAPEILSETGYGKEVDLWSLGIIMHILLCGYAPFRSSDREKLFQLIQDGALVLQDKHWQHINKDTKRTVRKLLQVDASKRMSAKQLLNSRWMTKMNKSNSSIDDRTTKRNSSKLCLKSSSSDEKENEHKTDEAEGTRNHNINKSSKSLKRDDFDSGVAGDLGSRRTSLNIGQQQNKREDSVDDEENISVVDEELDFEESDDEKEILPMGN